MLRGRSMLVNSWQGGIPFDGASNGPRGRKVRWCRKWLRPVMRILSGRMQVFHGATPMDSWIGRSRNKHVSNSLSFLCLGEWLRLTYNYLSDLSSLDGGLGSSR